MSTYCFHSRDGTGPPENEFTNFKGVERTILFRRHGTDSNMYYYYYYYYSWIYITKGRMDREKT